MKSVLQPYLEKFVVLFVDNILDYSYSMEKQEKHLVAVLGLLKGLKIYIKIGKCEFFHSQIHYLGHIILKKGEVDDPEKIKAIMELPIPRNVAKIRSFMGSTGYYKRFIKDFYKIGYPIIVLQKKVKKLEWIVECTTSFEPLKHLLIDTLVLRIADPDKHFMVDTHAYKEGDHGVLMYEG